MNLIFILVVLLPIIFNPVHGAVVETKETKNSNSILEWKPPAELRKRFPYVLSGFDKEGAAVFVVETGRWDIRSFVESGKEEIKDFEKYMEQVAIVLTSPELLNGSNPDVDPPNRFIIISDMEGYDIRQVASAPTLEKYLFSMRAFVDALRNKKNNVKKGFFVNSNFVFQSVWNLLKPIFGDTLAFMEMYGTRNRRWKSELLEYIDQDQLPEFLGGVKNHKPVKIYP